MFSTASIRSGRGMSGARVLEVQSGGSVAQIQVEFINSSLASQAVGPPGSDFETTCGGRSFLKLGKKMLSVPPLALQRVHHQDSVLGGSVGAAGRRPDGCFLHPPDRGGDLRPVLGFRQTVRCEQGLQPVTRVPRRIPTEYTLMEANFSLIWGLAIQLYESTLISDQSPFDQFAEGNASALSNKEKAGMEVFLGAHKGQGGRCINCHQGPVFTGAAAPFREDQATEAGRPEQMVERMRLGNGDDIEEDLLRFFILGDGTVGGYTLSGQAGSRELPDSYPATVGGDFSVNSCQRDVYSYLMNQDTFFIPNPAPIPIPPVYRGESPNTATTGRRVPYLRGCGEWLQITLIEGGPGADTGDGPGNPADHQATTAVRSIADRGHRSADDHGAIVGDFTLNSPGLV